MSSRTSGPSGPEKVFLLLKVSAMSAPVVIIGGGLAGISAACHLAAKGFRVHLLKKTVVWADGRRWAIA